MAGEEDACTQILRVSRGAENHDRFSGFYMIDLGQKYKRSRSKRFLCSSRKQTQNNLHSTQKVSSPTLAAMRQSSCSFAALKRPLTSSVQWRSRVDAEHDVLYHFTFKHTCHGYAMIWRYHQGLYRRAMRIWAA